MTLFVGIDNGLNGGIACLNNNKTATVWKMPVIKGTKTDYDIREIIKIIKTFKRGKCYIVLEKAHPRVVSGKRACFMTGYGYGLMQGLLSALDIPYMVVTPQAWQKEILSGITEKDTKVASIKFCQKMFPNVDLTPTERSVKPHDGISDALCMAEYCFRINRG